MGLIKLPINIGIEVVKQLKVLGIEPRTNSLGILSLEFTEEELSKIKELTILNPSPDSLKGIELLSHLEKLTISTLGRTAYRKEKTSITDKDIAKIGQLSHLKSLTINNQSEISWVYLDHLTELEELTITRNAQLEEVSGLPLLTHLKELSIYGNKDLYQIDGIVEFLQKIDLDALDLDLLNYPEVESLKAKLASMINCRFVETLSGGGIISYSTYQVSLFHQKCKKIVERIKQQTKNQRGQIIGIEKFLAENVTYDYEALEQEDRIHMEDGKRRGKKNGTNSAYNGIMYGSCVCEGYTRSMQYLLKLLGIKTRNVYCIAGANQISINRFYHDQVTLPRDGYHSIIRIDSENMLYCDPCWDSCYWHEQRKNLPYCLLTKEEISKDHTLSFEEDIISNNQFAIPRETIQYIASQIDTSPEKAEKPKVQH